MNIYKTPFESKKVIDYANNFKKPDVPEWASNYS